MNYSRVLIRGIVHGLLGGYSRGQACGLRATAGGQMPPAALPREGGGAFKFLFPNMRGIVLAICKIRSDGTSGAGGNSFYSSWVWKKGATASLPALRERASWR